MFLNVSQCFSWHNLNPTEPYAILRAFCLQIPFAFAALPCQLMPFWGEMGDDFYVLRQGEASVTVHTVKGDKASRATAGFVPGKSPAVAVRWWGASGLETTLGRKPSWPQHLGGLNDHGLATSWCYLLLPLDIILCQHGPLNEDPRSWARGAAHSHDHLREFCRMLKDPAAGPVKGRVPSDAFGEES